MKNWSAINLCGVAASDGWLWSSSEFTARLREMLSFMAKLNTAVNKVRRRRRDTPALSAPKNELFIL